MFCLFLRFFHYGEEKSVPYSISPCVVSVTQLLSRDGRAASLFWFYPVTGKFSFLVSSTSYKPFDSKSFILCEHFRIRFSPDLGDPLLIGGLARFHRACYLGLSPVTNSVFSCHCWHPFRSAFTSAVSSRVVATLYCIFTIFSFPALGDSSSQLRFIL